MQADGCPAHSVTVTTLSVTHGRCHEHIGTPLSKQGTLTCFLDTFHPDHRFINITCCLSLAHTVKRFVSTLKTVLIDGQARALGMRGMVGVLQQTWHDVGHMHVPDGGAVLAGRGSRLAVPVALMRPRPVPLHLLTALGHAKVEADARQRPAPARHPSTHPLQSEQQLQPPTSVLVTMMIYRAASRG